MIKTINGYHLAKMAVQAAGAMEAARQEINELNVFPVPDGDTGTNMSLTFSAAVVEVEKQPSEHIGFVSDLLASGLLRGARGNSGVILSLLFRGISRHIKDKKSIDGTALAGAFLEGVDAAYRAVMKPAEGTVLTVSRMAAARAKDACTENTACEYVLQESLIAAKIALDETVYQNPVLTKAGVVDAGGKGYCVILEAMLNALRGGTVTRAPAADGVRKEKADFSEYTSDDIRFAYCTEFMIIRNIDNKRDPIKLQAFLGSIGDSLVFVDDDTQIKIHVHSNNPGKVLEEALLYGALTSIKIENMREQHTGQLVGELAAKPSAGASPKRRFGFVAVCSGKGISEVFKDLGVDCLVEGGQTMNPSTDDILSQINACMAEIIFVLPNNKNIIMTAEQCANLSDKRVIILPSASIPQGISAMLSFDATLDENANREAMTGAMSSVTTGHITYAARESIFDGHTIKEGDHLALIDNQLLYTNTDIKLVAGRLADELAKKEPSFINVFYGESIRKEEAEEFVSILSKALPNVETVLIYGGQPIYYYLISAE